MQKEQALIFTRRWRECHWMIKLTKLPLWLLGDFYASQRQSKLVINKTHFARDFESCKSTSTKCHICEFIFNIQCNSHIPHQKNRYSGFLQITTAKLPLWQWENFVNLNSHSFRLAAYRQDSTEHAVPLSQQNKFKAVNNDGLWYKYILVEFE